MQVQMIQFARFDPTLGTDQSASSRATLFHRSPARATLVYRSLGSVRRC